MRAIISLLMLSAALSPAQESRGWILGRVTDPSGAAVAKSKVSALNLATNTLLSGITNPEGNYEIPYLLPGTYRVSAELAGFSKAVRDNVELRTADRLALNFQLR